MEVAKMFEDNGIKYLHLVDLDGAKSNHIVNYKTLEGIANHTNLEIDFGGGIKSTEDVQTAFSCGAKQVTAGSIAAKNPELFTSWLKEFGVERIILGADCRNRKIATHGWLNNSDIDVVDYILTYQKQGILNVVCTDIAKDGMLQGPSIDLYTEIIEKTSINLIASGGITSIGDLERLNAINCYGAIIGKAIYEGKITMRELNVRRESYY
jgi:phosphoribosylformimino-5-aminoimidazole carboxamide ribotide isomerase